MQSAVPAGQKTMTTIRLVQYTTHPEHTADNQALVEAVFAELQELSPRGFRYTVVLTPETDSFTHLVVNEEGSNPLAELSAFADFRRGFNERVVDGPRNVAAELIGSYDGLSDAVPAIPADRAR